MASIGFMPPARNAAGFENQGRISARMGNTRSPDNEYRMPVFGMGISWQHRAFARGFRSECLKMGRTVIEGATE
jgi:hypothetical protein